MRDGLLEVKEVFSKTGLTRKQLHQCDDLNLVKPTRVQNDAGYKLYDEKALDKLYEVGLYASLGLSIQEIKERMDDPTYDREAILTDIIDSLKEQYEHILNQIAVAEQLRLLKHRVPEFDSYVIRHMDEVGAQYRKVYEPGILHRTQTYIEEMEKLTGSEIARFLPEFMNYKFLSLAMEQHEEG